MRRVALILLFLLFATGLWVGCHLYLAQRLVLDPGVTEPWRSGLLVALAALAASLVLAPFGERLLKPPFSRAIAWPASLWMGFSFLLLLSLLASDALLWLAGPSAAAAPALGGGGVSSAASVRAAAVVLVALVAGAFGLVGGLRPPRHRRVEIRIARWPRALDGFRIVQISDLHLGPILGRRFSEELVARVNALDPDLVALTGDLVDGAVGRLADEVGPLAGLRARHGVFFVTGNHDHYSGADAWAEKVRALGMRVLRNERVAIGRGDALFDLVGVDDHRGDLIGGGGENLPQALAGRDASRPAVLLAHDPTTFRNASGMGIDLQLSGHTHGGQIWPFGYFVRLIVPYVAGHHRENGAQLYVSRGTGFWGPPMRLAAPSEVTEFIIASEGESA